MDDGVIEELARTRTVEIATTGHRSGYRSQAELTDLIDNAPMVELSLEKEGRRG